MKQHITSIQLNELSDKGKERLREWWNKRYSNMQIIDGTMLVKRKMNFRYFAGNYKLTQTYECCPTIGQMLEFLAEKGDLPKFSFDGGNAMEWTGIDRRKKQEFLPITGLCDKLWEAVKTILEP